MRVLMSFCNVGLYNSQFSLALLDLSLPDPVALVDCAGFIDPDSDSGVTGLVRLGDGGLALAVQSGQPRVVFLNADLSLRRVVRSERFADLHSLHERDGFLFCCSSGNNKILKIALGDYAVSLFWEYPIDEPFLHINSLAFVGERALACSHKIPPETGTASGGCWFLDDFDVLIPGLKQPHTVTSAGEAVWCLSSHDEQIAVWRGGEVTARPLKGYLRGLMFEGDQVLVGCSSRRFVSRKRKGVQRYADFAEVIGNPAYMSSLAVCGTDLEERARAGTTTVGFESYDLIADPGVPETLLRRPAAPVRMQTMQRQLIATRELLAKAREGAA
ncbi:MAG TPA: hypothetical protein VF559_08890 [Caulobacteraceae bacterium]|jgi:hypothetical protein